MSKKKTETVDTVVSKTEQLFKKHGWNNFADCVAGVALTLKESGKTQLRISKECNFAIPLAGALYYGAMEGMKAGEIAGAFGTSVNSIYPASAGTEKVMGGIVLPAAQKTVGTTPQVIDSLIRQIESATGESFPKPVKGKRGATKTSLADIAQGFSNFLTVEPTIAE